jgi:hypothetical protein
MSGPSLARGDPRERDPGHVVVPECQAALAVQE